VTVKSFTHESDSDMKVAIIHYWLTGMRGGERVLEQLCELYPTADIYTHVYDPKAVSDYLRKRTIRTTFIQKLPLARRWYQKYLPFMPLALELLDLQQYDLIISSESGPAKGIIARPDATHVCYCHSPMRYIWDQYHIYEATVGRFSSLLMAIIASKMRIWDVTSAIRVDQFVANSTFVAHRIRKFYRRNSKIVHPPVPIEKFQIASSVEDYYLWVGELVPYKRADLAVESFNRLGYPLLIVGKGSEKKRLQRMAKSNIRFLDELTFHDLQQTYAKAKALIFTSKEDFGIVVIEALASGRPVVAFGGGGALDTVIPYQNGILFAEATPDCLVDAVNRLETWLPQFDPVRTAADASKYSAERFRREMRHIINHSLDQGLALRVHSLPPASRDYVETKSTSTGPKIDTQAEFARPGLAIP